MEAYLMHLSAWSAAGMIGDALAHGVQFGLIVAVVMFRFCSMKLTRR